MNLLFKRTFYPVGQGAFYAAEVYQQTTDSYQRLFRAVYDCGTFSSDSETIIGNIINTDMTDREVDVLFISHFDRDHINQIHQLKPKNVVIPFISDDQAKVLEIFTKYFDEELFDYEAYRNLEKIFPNNPRIIRVHPFDEGQNLNLRTSLDLTDHEGDHIIDLAGNSSIWINNPTAKAQKLMEYVVFAPKFNNYFEEVY